MKLAPFKLSAGSIGSLLIILLFTCFHPIACFSAPQTANTTDGATFTFGIYELSTKKVIRPFSYREPHYENHYHIIFMPRVGGKATQKQFGIDFGFDLATEEPPPDGELPIVLLGEDFKLQIPKNRYVDFAIDFRFWRIYPSDLSFIISKDLSKVFTLYGKGGWSSRSYILPRKEDENRVISMLTLGSQIKLHKNVSFLVEMERWFNPEWDRRESLRFAGVFCFNVASRNSEP
jgi:hypothetical protein